MIQAVLDHLWQSTLFTLLVTLLAWICHKDRAEIRFALWFAASVKFLVPFPLIVLLGRRLRWEEAPAIEIAPNWSQTLDRVVQPAAATIPPVPMAPPAAEPVHFDFSSLFFGLWAAGTVLLLARWAWQAWSIAKTARNSSPLPIEAPLPVRSAPGLPQPGIFGLFRPVLLLPERIFADLTPPQLAAILSHELCHWRRRDNQTAGIMQAPLSLGLPATRRFLLAAAGCLAVLGPIVIGLAMVSPHRILAQEEMRVDPAVLDRYAGDYDMPPFSVLTVTREDDQLRVQKDGRGAMSLFADDERDFSARSTQATLTFVVDGGGNATAMIWHERGADHVYRRIDASVAATIGAFRDQRLAASAAMPGSEAALRRFLDYPGPPADPSTGGELASLGALQSLAFEGVLGGWDVYHAHFAEGDWELRLVVTPEGAIRALEHQSFRPAKKMALEEIAALKSNPPASPPDKEAIDRMNKLWTDIIEGRAEPPRNFLRGGILEFVNSSATAYQLYAVDYKGDFHSYGPLPPNGLSVQRIFDMDKWVIAIDRDHPVQAFAASSGLTVAAIE